MDLKERVALELTAALITADPTILKGNDPQLIDRRIRTAIDLFVKVSDALDKRFEKEAPGQE
jgi:hypothetical protein